MRSLEVSRSARLGSNQQISSYQMHLLLAKVADAAIAAVLLICPLFMGGRDERGAFVYVLTVMTAAIAFCASNALAPSRERSSLRRTTLDYVLLAGLLLLCLQMSPLSSSAIERLSPNISGYLPAWTLNETGWTLGEWKSLTFAPHSTRTAAAVYLAHMMLFMLLVLRLSKLEDIRQLFKLMSIGCVAFALLGLVQYLAGNGKFLWIYEHPYRETAKVVKGPFSNENHFAHLLALGIGPCIWWLQTALNQSGGSSARDKLRRSTNAQNGNQAFGGTGGQSGDLRKPPPHRSAFGSTAHGLPREAHLPVMLMCSLSFVGLAGLLTFSRGGALGLFAASGVAVGLYFAMSMLAWRYAVALIGSASLVMVALTIFGGDVLTDELRTISSGDLDQMDEGSIRRELWAADLSIASEFLLTGTGAGSHSDVYPLQFERHTKRYYSHAESGYIQVLLECGVPGLTLLVFGLVIAGTWLFKVLRTTDPPLKALAIASAAGLTASLLQSLWDFVWYIPACLSWTIALLAVLCRLNQLSSRKLDQCSDGTASGATSWSLAAVILSGVAWLMYQTLAPAASAQTAWENFLKHEEHAELNLEEFPTGESDKLLVSISMLDSAVTVNSHHAKAHLALASCCLQQFEIIQRNSPNRMDLTQIRAAALASNFTSRDELDAWLQRAIGESRIYLDRAKLHALQAVRLSPLSGMGYVYLSELAFLDGAGTQQSEFLMAQAQLVRPHKSAVCFAAGAHAAMRGNLEQTLLHWKKAFRQDRRYRDLIVDKLAPQVTGAHFVESFAPDRLASRRAFDLYHRLGRTADANAVGDVLLAILAEVASQGTREQSARAWCESAVVLQKMQRSTLALQALGNAVQAMPDDFDLRCKFALELLRQNEYLRAEEELSWCLARRPGNARLRELAIRAKKRSMETAAGSSIRPAPPKERR